MDQEMTSAQKFRCSFCGKTQDQVRRLIAGPGGIHICDECVTLCNEILDEEVATTGGQAGRWRARTRRKPADEGDE